MTRVCEVCGKEFEQKPGVRPMRFCSRTCSRRYESAQRAHDAEYKARRAARDRAYAATPEGRERLRAAVRKYREKKRAARLAALQERLASSPIHCQRCGAPLDPQRPGRKVYCAECGHQVNREKTRENMAIRYAAKKAERQARTCPWCGKAFTPANGNQVYCSKECKAGADRKRSRDRYASKASGGGLTDRQIAQVKADVLLPPSERYAASKEWTPAMHTYARKLYENHNGLFSAYRPSTGFNS